MSLEKILIDNKTLLKDSLVFCGLNREVFWVAKKAKQNIALLIYENILKHCNGYSKLSEEEKAIRDKEISSSLDIVKGALYGALGNYYAYKNLVDNGFDVQLEYYISDAELNTSATPDLAIKSPDGQMIFCEVKTIDQILSSLDNYVDNENINLSYRKDDPSLKKYTKMREKLLSQLTKLKRYCACPIAIVYSDCFIDKETMKEIDKIGAKVYKIGNKSFEDIKNEVDNFINNVIDYYKNNVILEIGVKSKASKRKKGKK